MYEGPLEHGPGDEGLMMRLVCDWSITDAEIAAFLEAAKG
jgi:threonine aldolase